MKVLVTGAAGFIGFHLVNALCQKGYEVVGLDNLNDYYNVWFKEARLKINLEHPNYHFVKMDITDQDGVEKLFQAECFDAVCHLAGQAGVRYSIQNPRAYAESNLIGYFNILDAARRYKLKHLVYASSSSIYGDNIHTPYGEDDKTDSPLNLYAATKKSNELMAHSYSHIYGLPTTGLRFFTVYGPWGRPDMAPLKFMEAIAMGKAIYVFNHGRLYRDFTYIDDIVEGISLILEHPSTENVPYEIYNLGHSSPVELMDFITEIEKASGKTAVKIMEDMQPGDMLKTFADSTKLKRQLGFSPQVSLHEGIQKLYNWYKNFTIEYPDIHFNTDKS